MGMFWTDFFFFGISCKSDKYVIKKKPWWKSEKSIRNIPQIYAYHVIPGMEEMRNLNICILRMITLLTLLTLSFSY